MPNQDDDYVKGFMKGFQDGLQDAWEEILRLTTKGYTSRELQIMAKTKKSMLYQRVQQKADELEKATGRRVVLSDVATPAAGQSQVRMTPGWSYVVKEDRPDRSFSIFTTLLTQGGRGLCISRTHPNVLKQKYGFIAESLWLTKTERPQGSSAQSDPEYVSPNNLAHLASEIKEFLAKGEQGAIIIEGLEYLNTQNDFKSVLKFVQLINEQVVLDKGFLIMPVDQGTMESKEFSLIEREMSQVL